MSDAANPAAQPARPRFFAGQTLTNRDLNDLVAWVRGHFILDRLREGWGVVCGLDVTVGAGTSGRSPVITVGTGNALDAAGNALVVTTPLTQSLPPVLNQAGRCAYLPKNTGTIAVGPFVDVLQARWAVFDLVLCTNPTDADAVAAACCGLATKCEPTRTLEGAQLQWVRRTWQELAPPPPPVAGNNSFDDPGIAFLQAFNGKFPNLFTFPITLPKDLKSTAAAVRDWLTNRAAEYPALLRTFPTLLKWLSSNGDRELSTYWGVARVLFWLADAVRRTTVACPAPAAGCPDGGVPLARVWAEAADTGDVVRFIDDAPPARRPFAADMTAALDPRTYVGRPWELTQLDLIRLGVSVTKGRFELPADGQHLLALYTNKKPLAPLTKVTALVLDATADQTADHAEPLAGRVVAILTDDSEWKPLLKTTGPLKVDLYPAAEQKAILPKFTTEFTGSSFTPAAIPLNGWVRLVVPLARFTFNDTDTAIGRTFFYHDELSASLVSVGTATAADKAIETTFQVDRMPPYSDLRVTVVLKNDSPDRLVAVTGVLSGDKPLLFMAASFHDNPPTLTIDPYKSASGAAKDRGIILLDGGASARLPLQVGLSNPGLTDITALLHYDKNKDQPTNPAGGVQSWPVRQVRPGAAQSKDATANSGAEIDGHPGLVFSIAMPAPGDKLWFWLTDGADAFLQPFDVPPLSNDRKSFNGPLVQPSFDFQPVNLKVEVSKTESGGPKPPLLKVTNNTGKPVTLMKSASALQLKSGAVEQPPLAADQVIAAAAAAEFKLTGDPTDQATPWRIVLDYKNDGDATTKSAAIQVIPS